jgi:hypothetical protein
MKHTIILSIIIFVAVFTKGNCNDNAQIFTMLKYDAKCRKKEQKIKEGRYNKIWEEVISTNNTFKRLDEYRKKTNPRSV